MSYTQRSQICNLLRPLIKILFLLVPYGYIIIKKIPKEMTEIPYDEGLTAQTTSTPPIALQDTPNTI